MIHTLRKNNIANLVCKLGKLRNKMLILIVVRDGDVKKFFN